MKTTSRALLLFALFLALSFPAQAGKGETVVTVTSPGGEVTKTLPSEGGPFALDVPLAKNSVNRIVVKAVDEYGNSASKELQVTQVSLDSVVVAQVTTERLSPAEVEELVNEGVIDLDDPANYNVSQFTIVLTVEGQPVTISIPVAVSVQDPQETGEGDFPSMPGEDSGGAPSPQPQEILVLLDSIAGPPGQPPVPLPGVLIIEGRIKSLKEFFAVRLLLLNTSGIFTLGDVTANIEFPGGGLTSIMPSTGTVAFGDILPGDGTAPGQAERQFIVRGDRVGVHGVKVNFGGVLTGPGIPEDEPIPFNGDAAASLEVKGPPTFQVQVFHPDSVVEDEPYDLRVDITNTGELPALYASLELDAGADAQLVHCTVDPETDEPLCEEIQGPETRSLGHIYPAKKVSQTFQIRPGTSGPIATCLGASDQNITLSVYVGNKGCMVGHYPPGQGDADTGPTVSLLPLPNALGVGVQSVITAFFSTLMDQSTIRPGAEGTFRVYDAGDNIVPGSIGFTQTFGRTIAVWRPQGQGDYKLSPNSEYRVRLDQGIKDAQGKQLSSVWDSSFTTTGDDYDDVTPPTVDLSVQPPVDPNQVLPGQLVVVEAYAQDQGSGVVRLEARLKDLDALDPRWDLIDQKSVYQGDLPPFLFAVDSGALKPGHDYQLMVTAYDAMANGQDATLSLLIAGGAPPPTLLMKADPGQPQLQGISIDLTPSVYGDTVKQIFFFLDGETDPFKIVTLAPFQASLGTLGLELGSHTVRAVGFDALDQSAEDTFSFELVENPNLPVVNFGSAIDGAAYLQGESFTVNGGAEDPVGIQSVEFYLDSTKADPVAVGTQPFLINTASLSAGSHSLLLLATNRLGVTNNIVDPASILTFTVIQPVIGPPPAAPVITSVSLPAGGQVTVTGTTAANARVIATNLRLNTPVTFTAAANGTFSVSLEAASGDTLRCVAYDFTQSQDPSAPADAVVPAPPVLVRLEADPPSLTFTDFGAFLDLAITAVYDDASRAAVSGQCSYTTADPAVATVGGSGRVVAQGNGATEISAGFGGLTIQVPVTVSVVALESLSVAPESLALTAVGETVQLTVTGHFSDGSTQVLTGNLGYSTADARVATVTLTGLVTARKRGATVITVAGSGVAPVNVPVTVTIEGDPAPVATITSPAGGTGVERGQQVSVAVLAEDEVGGVARVTLTVTGEAEAEEIRQVAPPQLSTIQTFIFTVPADAQVGGTITVRAVARDTGNQDSAIAQISLNVVDLTPPVVTIDEPAPESVFNYGTTVTVRITATDGVAVNRIRYTTTGGLLLSGSQDINPAASPASATFTIDIPSGIPEPDVYIHAFARDTSGNEGESGQVHIIASMDVTPPSTAATAVSDPGGGPTATVQFQVTEGLSDLDHLELFFRRNNLGTFNRYTDADRGNPEGLFHPTSGNQGSILFDSTKMGGDGAYEFYTVGVDKAGNREPAPTAGKSAVVPDQTVSFLAGTVWQIISSPLFLGPTDTQYDNQNLRVTGTTLTLGGHHAFHNLELVSGATLTHPETDINNEYFLDLETWTLAIDSTSAINLDARGYLGGGRPGNDCSGQTLGNNDGSDYRAGGSYGGPGASFGGTPNPTYGLITEAVELGSGGSCGPYGYVGGDGGGRLLLASINLVNDGRIRANGGTGNGYQAGSGSGGGIRINTSTLSGVGTITANGGANEVGGGGGRIVVNYVDLSTLDTSLLRALGGQGSQRTGGNGSVCLKNINEGNGTLVVDGQNNPTTWTPLAIPPGYIFDNVVLQNGARIYSDVPIEVSDTLELKNNSILTHSTNSEAGLVVAAKKVTIDTTSSIDVTARGFRGGGRDGNSACEGITLGQRSGASYRAAGSYGGRAGVFEGSSNLLYGHPAAPLSLGSGGGCGPYGYIGGNGGGLIHLTATETLIVNGAIRADGGTGNGYQAGSGSGGSIRINTSLLMGTGSISAAGGAYEVGGSGGRIAITYDYLGPFGGDFNGTRSITALGGKGANRWGAAGTVLLKHPGQTFGNLILDDAVEGSSATNWIELTTIGFGKITALTDDTLTTDGTTPYQIDGLKGLEVNPNQDQSVTFQVVSNTADTITVDTSKGYRLIDVAQIGDTIKGIYRFDNVTFRRGAIMLLGDQLVVGEKLTLDEYTVLSHYTSTKNATWRLDLTVDELLISSDSRIDVTGRGYLGGSRSGNDCTGQTLGNTDGSPYRTSGSYGGLGVTFEGGVPNAIYGNQTDPADLGSGGGCGPYGFLGGTGGGFVRLRANAITLDGQIVADGQTGGGYQAGSGSGGTINIHTGSLDGAGTVSASGGAYEVGGGGGRIAIAYDTLGLPSDHIRVTGGHGANRVGGNGTLWLKQSTQSLGDLIIDGQGLDTPTGSSPIPEGTTYDNLILRNKAQVISSYPLIIRDRLSLENGSILTHPTELEAGLTITARNLSIDATSTINASSRGYRGGQRDGNNPCEGLTQGRLSGARYRAAGSYGGYGYEYEGAHNLPYGQPLDPRWLGSGGGCGPYNFPGGNGGGLVQIQVEETLTVDGSITADGGSGSGYQAGSGSGGSILIQTHRLEGNGLITANGGPNEVGGGGGRILIDYSELGGTGDDLNATRNITATGGKGVNGWGSAGTLVLRQPGQTYGTLIIDDAVTGQTSDAWTPLTRLGWGQIAELTADTFKTDGKVALHPNALIGLTVNPNLDQGQTFRVLANTADTITVDTTGGIYLTDVAAVGDAYAGSYRFDHLLLRRGGYLVLDDPLTIDQTARVTENGRVSHFDTDLTYEPRLDLTAYSLDIDGSSSINVDLLGYLGGNRAGLGNTARTLGNTEGSTYRSGGSFGGLGGAYGGTPNPVYGSATEPGDLGSGGSGGPYGFQGGDGGGRIRLVTHDLRVDGIITAGGGTGGGYQSGSGSGGSILILTGSLTGNGTIRANGGGYEVGGGGGRVSIRYHTLTFDPARIQANGGQGINSSGQNGTLNLEAVP